MRENERERKGWSEGCGGVGVEICQELCSVPSIIGLFSRAQLLKNKAAGNTKIGFGAGFQVKGLDPNQSAQTQAW